MECPLVCMSCLHTALKMRSVCANCGDTLTIVPARMNESALAVDSDSLLATMVEGEEVKDFEFLGHLPKKFSFVLFGDPGAGKSRTALYLAHRIKGKTLYVSTEQDLSSFSFRKMVQDIKRVALEPLGVLHYANCDSVAELFEKMEGYDNVILDSLSALNRATKSKRLGISEMRKLQQNLKIFGYLLHSTKKNGYQGETWLTHEPEVVMRVKKFSKVQVEKNRFGETRNKTIFKGSEAKDGCQKKEPEAEQCNA